MLSYIVRRLLLIVPTLVGMTALVFFIVALSPGGVGAALLSQEMGMRPSEREALRKYYNERYGLDKPVVVQYARWLNSISPIGFARTEDRKLGAFRVKAPDLGESYARGRPVGGMILEALPVTLLLNALALPLTYGIATLVGIYAARHRGKLFDTVSGTFFLAMWSVPVILAGVLMIGYLANEQYFKWFPAAGLSDMLAGSKPFLPTRLPSGEFEPGWLLDRLWHLALPVLCLSYGQFAFLSKLSRGAVLENMRADFVRTARAKGLGERDVLFRHVLSNSLIPLITQAAHLLPAMIAGSVVVETIFSVPGMGRLLVDSIKLKDREVFLSITMIAGMLTLAGYLLADILYAVVDPRVSYE